MTDLKYSFVLPLSALLALCFLTILVSYDVIPPGIKLLEELESTFSGYFYWLILLIILLESIVYVGFYFPGQFFAVVLVVLSEPGVEGMALLTVSMVVAATIGSSINYLLGKRFGRTVDGEKMNALSLKKLLLAMIHINSLAFFMFAQGASRQSFKIVFLAAFLNLPYYLLLVWGTSLLSEQVMQMAENTWFLASAVFIWLIVALYMDYKKLKNIRLTKGM